jgi:DNA-binding transcriptional regulator YdaS (Cro superfamily)
MSLTPDPRSAAWLPHILSNLTGLDRAIAWAGSARKLGQKLGVSGQTIMTWRQRRVPAERVLPMEQVTGISRHDLRPDLYPRTPTGSG